MTTINPQVAVRNLSTVLTDAQVQDIVTGLQHQVTYDFGPAWGRSASLHFYSASQSVPATYWQLQFKDNSDQPGALGYHDLTTADVPIMYIFAKTCQQAGVSPSSCASHELLEALGDPDISLGVQHSSTTWYAYEDADPVEQLSYNVLILNGVTVELSDFVTPNWFVAGSPGPWDHMKKLTQAFELYPGGSYIGVWTATTGWTQKNADGTTTTSPAPDDARKCLRPFQRKGQV